MKSLVQNLALASFCFAFSNASAAPPVAPFYESVIQMSPTGVLGQVIKKEQIQTSLKGAQAWKIAYISSDVSGRKTISTGLVVAPTGSVPAGGRPIMTWAHGTTGTAQNCGPSQVINPAVPMNEYFLMGGNSWTDYGIPALEEFIKEGYVVVATDYQGLGGGGKHQYAVAVTNGMDAINAARAAGSMNATGANKKAVFYGWSQGGGAALAASTLPDYINQRGTAFDNINFVGFIAMGPQYALASAPTGKLDQAGASKFLADLLKSYIHNIFDFTHATMFLWGTQAAFPDLKLSDLFTDEGVKAVNQIYSNKCMHAASDTMNYYFKDGYNALLKTNQGNALAWAEAVYKGSAQPVKPVAPVQIYYGSLDNVNPPAMGALFQKQMCGLGGNVGRMELPGKQTHFDEPRGSQQFFLPWIKDRVAGKPLANGCPSS